jgi:anthraniloyl-CoA monooxygenase
VTLTGPASRSALLDRLALGERIRSELGARVAVTCAEPQLPDAVDGLVAGRTDLIRVGKP